MNNEPPILPGCTTLPPMNPRPRRAPPEQAGNKPKGKRHTADRFGMLNGFVDCSMADLSRAEALTWLVLYRDTRNGTARTGATDIARRIGSCKRAVLYAIGGLRRRGLVTLVHHGGINRGVSVYHVHPLLKIAP